MSFTIAIREPPYAVILDVSGCVTFAGARTDLRDAIRDAVAGGQKNILLNLADVTYIDSSGLGQLVGGYATVRNNGGQIKLLNLNDEVYDLMQRARLLSVFNIYRSEHEAIRSFVAKTGGAGPG